ncbi:MULTISPECIES: MOSC domain-containing protein [unclassified Paenibacillus]|uniref:MOSC domain-containing protein n=1 Tax=unclassified Paenibacillus TaxID=185978 RepID=UPI000B87F211|nr:MULTISPECIES: MOSC domain-containing protein [unclassified Paenibacillus]
MIRLSFSVISVNIAQPRPLAYQSKFISSGIDKKPVQGSMQLSFTNLDGDGQADLVHHGGPDKALCAYPQEHYAYWERELDKTLGYGAFGENLTVAGLVETDVHIGDIFQWGEAVIQLSQPRQPCFKLSARHGVPKLPKLLEETGYTGYYFRVLREGAVSAQEPLQLLERHPMAVSVESANQVMHKDKRNADAIRRLLELPELSESWQDTLRSRLFALG